MMLGLDFDIYDEFGNTSPVMTQTATGSPVMAPGTPGSRPGSGHHLSPRPQQQHHAQMANVYQQSSSPMQQQHQHYAGNARKF